MGGEDIDANPRLRAAVASAKAANMPADNIKRAIQKGAGVGKGDDYEAITYEGYGPHQVAVIIECLTDNRNRTISNIRTIFNKNNGNIGSTNSVMYAFDRVGLIEVAKDGMEEDQLMELALEAGAQDFDPEGEDYFEITTALADLHLVQTALEAKGVVIQKSALAYVPQNRQEITDPEKAAQVMRFLEAIEDDDDVQNLFTNLDLSDEAMAGMND
ncbi:MAG: hypothetical protein A2508_04190 [Candidatus Lambdaproteobacteria bacterium RIFOXYD12_FULL_49_8]|nr:MAG: hypothetical protein A2508_04190 [Candidatus Lambdaproteobacteria bacterium RIFOXYD12_FULL_49_8]